MIDAKLDAIEQQADLAYKRLVIKHLGHCNDPELVQVQYMDDNNMLPNKASLVVAEKPFYVPGPLSMFKIADPEGLANNTENSGGKYDDKKLYLSRASSHYDGHGKYVESGGVRAKWMGTFKG
jgi:hypothetical protein